MAQTKKVAKEAKKTVKAAVKDTNANALAAKSAASLDAISKLLDKGKKNRCFNL